MYCIFQHGFFAKDKSMQRIFFSLVLLSSCVMHSMEFYIQEYFEQKREVVRKENSYQEAHLSDMKMFGRPDKSVALWVKKEIVPELGNLPRAGVHAALDKVSLHDCMAYLRHENTQSSLLPIVLWHSLPNDLVYDVTRQLCGGDKDVAHAFNACCEQKSVGEALLCLDLVSNGKRRIPGLSVAQNFEILCSSGKGAYILCKRLMPEFKKQNQDIIKDQVRLKEIINEHRAQGFSQEVLDNYRVGTKERLDRQNKEKWKSTQELCVTHNELALINALPLAVKQKMQQNCVRPPKSLSHKAKATVFLVMLPVLYPLGLPPLILVSIICDNIRGGRSLYSFSNIFTAPYSMAKGTIKEDLCGFGTPTKLGKVIPGFVSGVADDAQQIVFDKKDAAEESLL
jgi:hypothetical protein